MEMRFKLDSLEAQKNESGDGGLLDWQPKENRNIY